MEGAEMVLVATGYCKNNNTYIVLARELVLASSSRPQALLGS
jgi:hypothetical protein